MTGPFTNGLMLILVVVGVILMFVAPFWMLYEMIKDKAQDHGAAWIVIPAWCIVSAAFILDGVWWVIMWALG